MTAVGIDFGTTNCVVSTFGSDGPEPLKIDTPPGDWATLGFDLVLPSVFAMESSQALFGWAAKSRFDLPSVQAVKRLLATDETVTLGTESVYVDEVVALLFGQLKMASAAAGVDFDQAVVTIPANSKGPARFRTKICAGLAGIDVMTLINEPTAAAMAFGLQAQSDQKILVFDFGGGTLDVTLLQATDGVFWEHASKGIGKLGGIDFDTKLGNKVRETIPDHQSWTEAQNGQFRLAVERAKILLTEQEETNLALPNGEYRRVSRKMFNDAVQPLIEKTREPILRCLADAGMSAGELDALVMVGGSSKVPAVREFVTDLVGREAVTGVDPMTAVGEGAAIAAAILTGQLETNDFFVSTEHAIGTAVLNVPTDPFKFAPIIPRNHKIPARESQTYKPVVDNQEHLIIKVMEGDEQVPFDHEENVVHREWEVDIPEPRPIDQLTFEFEFEYDVSGILYVTVRDLERDNAFVNHEPITFGVTRDKRALVELAGRVNQTLEGQAQMGAPTASPGSAVIQDPEARALVEQARSKIIPFLDGTQAASLVELTNAVEQAQNGTLAVAKTALETEIRKYSYLL